jgi:hypothetical protein
MLPGEEEIARVGGEPERLVSEFEKLPIHFRASRFSVWAMPTRDKRTAHHADARARQIFDAPTFRVAQRQKCLTRDRSGTSAVTSECDIAGHNAPLPACWLFYLRATL